jgi:hypothetical protein
MVDFRIAGLVLVVFGLSIIAWTIRGLLRNLRLASPHPPRVREESARIAYVNGVPVSLDGLDSRL